ncbi:amidase [Legionella israelensis]|nr:amidase [Legionella israelensis]QBS08776.1 amidase [Legionella israelensis]
MRIFINITLFVVLFAHLARAEIISDKDCFSSFPQDINIKVIHHAIKTQQITCERLIQCYIMRIKAYNLSSSKHAPINAFTTIHPNVMDKARQLDVQYSQTKQLAGSLHCIPVILKDNINSYDSTTTSGSLALLGNQPNKDAFLVSQLRKAGAIILGKGSMDELASGMFGISSRSGRIGNPYDTNRNPGGSSGGPAAAVSANFAVIGIGTDNSGSIRIPAAFNGVYGLRPSIGLVSQRGIFPAGNLDGVAGPFARNIEDLAIVLDVIAKKDPKDIKTQTVPRKKSYSSLLRKQGLKGKRIGILRQVGNVDTFKDTPNNIRQKFNQALQVMKHSGAVLIDNVRLPLFINDRTPNMAGMREDVNAYLKSFPAVRKSIQDICESNRTRVFGDAEQCMSFYDSLPIKYGKQYDNALKNFAKNKHYVENIMNQQQLEALLIPISRTGTATYEANEINTWLAPVSSNSGLPALAINIGYLNKMPVGIELLGKPFAEGRLIEIAYSFEKNSPPRIYPNMPKKNKALEGLDIAKYNNLLTLIGYRSYIEVLKNNKQESYWQVLSSDVFKEIVNRIINTSSVEQKNLSSTEKHINEQ